MSSGDGGTGVAVGGAGPDWCQHLSSPMIALVHNILPPYRVSLFNAIGEATGGAFRVLLVRENHPGRRKWTVPWDDVRFDYDLLPGWSFDRFGQHRDVSVGVGRALDRCAPDAVVLAGWDLVASWAALRWCRARSVPAVAWVESWHRSGRHRGTASNAMRSAFLRQCSAVLVPGQQASDFVQDLVPGLPTVTMPNSVDAAALRTLPPPEPGGRALFIGEMTDRKGVDLLLAGRHRVLDHFSHLTFAGVGPHLEEARRLADRDPRVEALGFVDGAAMVDLMSQASAVLMPSRSDPWPLVPVEGLVAGRPVLLGPGVGSAPDLIALGGGSVGLPDLTIRSLATGAHALAREQVPDEVRRLFTAADSATAFVAAAESALGRP